MTPRSLLGRALSAYLRWVGTGFGRRWLVRGLGPLLRGVPMRSVYGPLLVANLRDRTNWACVAGSRQHLHPVIDHIRQLSSGECFLDVGANVGLCSLVAAEAVGPDGVVLSFEPQPEIFAALVKNLRLNRAANVIPFPLAICVQSRVAEMTNQKATHSGGAFLRVPAQGDPAGDRVLCASFCDLPVVTVAIGRRRVTVKIDVEGYELAVVRALAASAFAPQITTMVVEMNERFLARFGGSCAAVIDEVAAMGLVPTVLRDAPHYDEVFVRPVRREAGRV